MIQTENISLLASAARTTAVTSASQTVRRNYASRGVLVTLDVTAASGTGGLTLSVNFVDPVTAKTVAIATASAAVTATGTKTYIVYPGAVVSGGSVTQAVQLPLPSHWNVSVAVGDASSYTYSVSACLLPV